ncbi:MAG TPA: radical SAM family heme chaperone HemW [Lachnospiraceae bacterium]|nr:radical SAM family heme chaperone HemW [Lachnospiraceae bacterium]
MQNLSLYLHIPFCIQKCAYCDFLSAPASDAVIDNYVDCLCKEIVAKAELYGQNVVDTIFIGGGTPSILSIHQMERINTTLQNHFVIASALEYSIEANPGTLNGEKLSCYRACGINRLSMGLQSANNDELKCLGRIHDYQSFLDNYTEARKCGFTNINVDLMSGLPGQTVQQYQDTLSKIVALQPNHISAYGLIIEENTPFYERYHNTNATSSLPSEEKERQMYYLCRELLSQAGYHQYEISNYAKTGYECKHNIGYWTGKNYLGMGLGASSMIHNTRWKNTESMVLYSSKATEKEEVIELSTKDQMEEFMFLGLRLTKGISCDEFKERFEQSVRSVYGEWLQKMEESGLIVWEQRIYLTKRGMDLANYVMTGFLL